MSSLGQLFTPCAIVNRSIVERNAARMNRRIAEAGIDLRPHVKTTKSIDIARIATAGHSGGITVSTLSEARYFADAGFADILYAVGIVPAKLDSVAEIRATGTDLKVILDSAATAQAVAEWSVSRATKLAVVIEINSDDHRAGLEPDSDELIEAARMLADCPTTKFVGVMTHAGASYECGETAQISALADRERDAVVTAAARLREAGIDCAMVSVGSTPTALLGGELDSVTEIRAGVYLLFDLFQAGLGVCTLDDIALSVLTTVIGHKPSLNRLLTDAGGLALSKDRGTASQAVDRRYGLVCDAASGSLVENLIVDSVNQEHGLVTTIDGSPLPFERYPIGSQLRILPNHACMTAAAHDGYFVIDAEGEAVSNLWPRCHGWQADQQDLIR